MYTKKFEETSVRECMNVKERKGKTDTIKWNMEKAKDEIE